MHLTASLSTRVDGTHSSAVKAVEDCLKALYPAIHDEEGILYVDLSFVQQREKPTDAPEEG